MQKVIYRNEIEKYVEQMEGPVVEYIEEGQIETFEGFDKYSIIAFDYYDIYNVEADPSQIMLYFDKDDLFIICEDDVSYKKAQECFSEEDTNERAMYMFFKNLFKGDTKNMEELDDKISELDDSILSGKNEKIREQIVDFRYEVLILKKYYEQFELIFEEICDNDNGLISEECLRYFEILDSRSRRLNKQMMNLREYIVQVRESYMSEIDVEQNRLMKVFTLVTSIFLPLSLIAGWYGMNLKMPEYTWDYGYPLLIGFCALVIIVWVVIFNKKGWFK